MASFFLCTDCSFEEKINTIGEGKRYIVRELFNISKSNSKGA